MDLTWKLQVRLAGLEAMIKPFSLLLTCFFVPCRNWNKSTGNPFWLLWKSYFLNTCVSWKKHCLHHRHSRFSRGITQRAEDGVVLSRTVVFMPLSLPTASGCAELDAAWSFYHFFFCFEAIWCGHRVATSRYQDHLGELGIWGWSV